MLIKLTWKNFNKTIKLGEFKMRDNVRLGCDDIPHTSGISTKYKLALFLPRGTDLIRYCSTFLIFKRFSYLLSQYLKWRHWMATAKLDPLHTAIKLHKICSIKIITRKTKNFQAAWNIIMNFNHQQHDYHQ